MSSPRFLSNIQQQRLKTEWLQCSFELFFFKICYLILVNADFDRSVDISMTKNLCPRKKTHDVTTFTVSTVYIQ